MSRVLVTGATGVLGTVLVQTLADRYEVIGLSFPDPGILCGIDYVVCDLRDIQGLAKLLARIRPHAVIHAAALTGVDACDADPAEAVAVNVAGTANLVHTCPDGVELLCYISTDFVFDGQSGGYSESDVPFPVNVYGCTKLAGERAVQRGHVPWAVIRTTFFGWGPGSRKSSIDSALLDLEAGRLVRGWSNRFSTPLYSGQLADTVATIVERREEGLWHAGSDRRVSNYDLLRNLAVTFGLDPDLVQPAVWHPETALTPRPLDVSLDSRRLTARLGRPPGGLLDGLERLRRSRGGATPGR